MTTTEMFAELLYAGKPLQELAGLDTNQLIWLYFRKRDKTGQLVRKGKAKGKLSRQKSRVKQPATFEEMFKAVKRHQSDKFKGQKIKGKVFAGYTEEEIERLWQAWLKKNPAMVKLIAKRKKIAELMEGVRNRGKKQKQPGREQPPAASRLRNRKSLPGGNSQNRHKQ